MNYNTEKPRCHLYFVLVYEHKVKTLSGSLDIEPQFCAATK